MRDVDLCLVAEGATEQLKAAQKFRRAMSDVWPTPSFTLIPIAPARLDEKKAVGDHFFYLVKHRLSKLLRDALREFENAERGL